MNFDCFFNIHKIWILDLCRRRSQLTQPFIVSPYQLHSYNFFNRYSISRSIKMLICYTILY